MVPCFVKRVWRALGLSLSLLLIAIILIYIQATPINPDPRRDTEVKQWILFESVRRACGLQGSNAPVRLPDLPAPSPWRVDETKPEQCNVIPLPGYPALDFAAFVTGVHRCILLYMWFYNLVLKLSGYSYQEWKRLREQPILISLDQNSFQDSFDKDNPKSVPKRLRGYV